MNDDIPIPDVLYRLPAADVLYALGRADIYLRSDERDRLIHEMHRTIRENQERYREEVRKHRRAA